MGGYKNRKSKLQQNTFFNPKQFIGSLHQKSHFKASETIKNTQKYGGSLKIGQDDIHNRYQEIANNLKEYNMD